MHASDAAAREGPYLQSLLHPLDAGTEFLDPPFAPCCVHLREAGMQWGGSEVAATAMLAAAALAGRDPGPGPSSCSWRGYTDSGCGATVWPTNLH
jgi:hypothetical protein